MSKFPCLYGIYCIFEFVLVCFYLPIRTDTDFVRITSKVSVVFEFIIVYVFVYQCVLQVLGWPSEGYCIQIHTYYTQVYIM